MDIPVATVTMQVLSHISHPPILAGGGALDSLSLFSSSLPTPGAGFGISWYPQLTPCRAAGVTARGISHGRGCRATPSTAPTPVLSRYSVGNAFSTTVHSRVRSANRSRRIGNERFGGGGLFTRWKRKEAGGRKKKKEGEAADPPPSPILQSRRTLCQFFLSYMRMQIDADAAQMREGVYGYKDRAGWNTKRRVLTGTGKGRWERACRESISRNDLLHREEETESGRNGHIQTTAGCISDASCSSFRRKRSPPGVVTIVGLSPAAASSSPAIGALPFYPLSLTLLSPLTHARGRRPSAESNLFDCEFRNSS
ncbi:uncharacterized protein BDZ83DRAFT_290504 [Colletotrichum acutatum]|uniref:Uncharacterized protein n=1 Tax=Glomerella acutata TaxID=27357 RepID=A0AAD8XNX2_GLOAC|nr:uncharacterized protein BDZ83DRAFT_290504 [Colletotrichum acutatum]KAK1730952.1 hypothetical protein BDZ83DRAFT_290504 [Colletotrichum acutatum]